MELSDLFDYTPLGPEEIVVESRRVKDGLARSLLTYPSAFWGRRAAALLAPEEPNDSPPILYVHWYEPAAPNSNRTQFEAEAEEMARHGAMCLLIETMWSDMDWFVKRRHHEDFNNSLLQIRELRQAIDVLLSQPGVDPSRLVYVGHDFGAMFGTLLGAVDRRPSAYVLMAATPRLTDWYLYRPPLDDRASAEFIEEMRPLDPIEHIGALAPARVLFQFATDDFHVPRERAFEYFNAAREPKELRWYDAGHGLNEQAQAERLEWVKERVLLN